MYRRGRPARNFVLSRLMRKPLFVPETKPLRGLFNNRPHFSRALDPDLTVVEGGLRSLEAVPNNLPSLQPFFGREAELAKVAEALDPDNRTWGALIDGPGGMGKTSLAVRAAYDGSDENCSSTRQATKPSASPWVC